MVVEHEQLDQIVDVTLVIRGVDDAVRPGRRLRELDKLRVPRDLPQDRIQRVLQGAIHGVSLGRPELFEIGRDALVGLVRGQTRTTAQVARHLFARQHGLRDINVHARNIPCGLSSDAPP